MQNGWSANHTHFRTSADYSNSYSSGSTSWGSGVWVEGHIGSIKADYYEIVWGDGTANTTLDHKILSRDNFTRGGLAIAPLVAATSASIALFRKWEYTVPRYGQLD